MAGKEKIMLKRVLAWILLAGFVLLIMNIMVFRFMLEASIMVYVIVAVIFLFTMSNRKHHE